LEAEKAILGPSTGSNVSPRDPELPSTPADVVAQLKSDLAEALRSKGQLQSRLRVAEDELEKLRTKSKADNRIVKDLHAERAVLMTKVKDRDEELRGKAKLLEVGILVVGV
jgi:chromosome segregation ATPase